MNEFGAVYLKINKGNKTVTQSYVFTLARCLSTLMSIVYCCVWPEKLTKTYDIQL